MRAFFSGLIPDRRRRLAPVPSSSPRLSWTKPIGRSFFSSASLCNVIDEPGLYWRKPFVQTVEQYDKRILDLQTDEQEVIASDQKRLIVDAFARYRIVDPLNFYKAFRTEEGARPRLTAIVDSTIRSVLGRATFIDVVRNKRAALMRETIKQVNEEMQAPVPASRSSMFASGVRTFPKLTAKPSTAACEPSASARRPRFARRQRAIPAHQIHRRQGRNGDSREREARGGTHTRRRRRRAQPDLRGGLQQGQGFLRFLPVDASL